MPGESSILLPYQLRYLNDPARRKLLVKSRRIGGTFIVALEETLRACGLRNQGGTWAFEADAGVRQNIISASEAQAIEHLQECRVHLEHLTRMRGAPRVVADSALKIELSNGAEIRAYAANPRTIRGGEGDVTFDEFGAMARSEEIWKAAKPLADPSLGFPDGFCLRATGTPLGDDNKFAALALTEQGRAFSIHTVSIHDAVAEGFPADVAALREEAGDADTFAQEYECSFLSSSSRYISAELWDRAVYYPGEAPPDRHDDGAAGYDVARKPGGDLSVCVEVERVGDTLWVFDHEARRGASWDTQEAWVAQVLERRRRIAIDSTGMGNQFAERLTQRFHESRVDAVEFTGRSKEELATGLKLALERGRLRVPDSADLRRDVLSLRREITAMGNTRFDAKRTVHGHADRAWALALAVYAAGGATRVEMTEAPRFEFTSERMFSSGNPFGGRDSGRGRTRNR